MNLYFLNDDTSVEFDESCFVKQYEKYYYLDGEKGVDEHKPIPHVSVNSKKAEDEIHSILSKGIKSWEEVNSILAWKIGGIDHQNSRDHIEFYDKWKGQKEKDGITRVTAWRFKCEINKFKQFCDSLCMNAIDIEETFNDSKGGTEKALEKIISVIKGNNPGENVVGLGPVYILTILYFITKKVSPIFDRYAYTAVKAIYNGVKPNTIWYENPSSNNVKDVMKVIEEYKWYLKQVFGRVDIERDIDRALWVYGHPNTLKEISKP